MPSSGDGTFVLVFFLSQLINSCFWSLFSAFFLVCLSFSSLSKKQFWYTAILGFSFILFFCYFWEASSFLNVSFVRGDFVFQYTHTKYKYKYTKDLQRKKSIAHISFCCFTSLMYKCVTIASKVNLRISPPQRCVNLIL